MKILYLVALGGRFTLAPSLTPRLFICALFVSRPSSRLVSSPYVRTLVPVPLLARSLPPLLTPICCIRRNATGLALSSLPFTWGHPSFLPAFCVVGPCPLLGGLFFCSVPAVCLPVLPCAARLGSGCRSCLSLWCVCLSLSLAGWFQLFGLGLCGALGGARAFGCAGPWWLLSCVLACSFVLMSGWFRGCCFFLRYCFLLLEAFLLFCFFGCLEFWFVLSGRLRFPLWFVSVVFFLLAWPVGLRAAFSFLFSCLLPIWVLLRFRRAALVCPLSLRSTSATCLGLPLLSLFTQALALLVPRLACFDAAGISMGALPLAPPLSAMLSPPSASAGSSLFRPGLWPYLFLSPPAPATCWHHCLHHPLAGEAQRELGAVPWCFCLLVK